MDNGNARVFNPPFAVPGRESRRSVRLTISLAQAPLQLSGTGGWTADGRSRESPMRGFSSGPLALRDINPEPCATKRKRALQDSSVLDIPARH